MSYQKNLELLPAHSSKSFPKEKLLLLLFENEEDLPNYSLKNL